MLASTHVKAPEGGNLCSIELCETVHFHMAGFRFELDAQQFDSFGQMVIEAHSNWKAMGKLATAEFIPLAHRWLPNEPVYPNRLEVEEQTIPVIHIHLRGLSTRWTIPEFKEFAKAIAEADKALG